jgi:hypothetical protein
LALTKYQTTLDVRYDIGDQAKGRKRPVQFSNDGFDHADSTTIAASGALVSAEKSGSQGTSSYQRVAEDFFTTGQRTMQQKRTMPKERNSILGLQRKAVRTSCRREEIRRWGREGQGEIKSDSPSPPETRSRQLKEQETSTKGAGRVDAWQARKCEDLARRKGSAHIQS